ncbi:YicC/YloC family endoribonuclease [Tautonia sociabilis]|uniref:YicC family protein n=1 Tax=Tautonia sociabilis TaxID=2080755 RepID=A0A432MLF1_9BACT|nr:YicC/YloC family endoribonuclease [Tautonia sociabilis]RUL88232.1 YicC family protein [Tautonia sociabilis]
MLLSMTGFGEARRQDEARTVIVEVRSVNGRHLKLSTRIGEPFSSLEPEVERLVRHRLKRGTVQLSIRVEALRRPEDYRLNLAALEGYRAQLIAFLGDAPEPPDFLSALLSLPGVVETSRPCPDDPRAEWPALEPVIVEALDLLERSRREEGRAMEEELRSLASEIASHLERIASRGPEVVSSYRDRLADRVSSLVAERGIAVEPEHLIREVAIFAERSDIAEEITRLRAHLQQFDAVISSATAADAPGRKLEFVVQEMGRETNTIGSKANDVEISRAVVEIKGALEKIRELIQNIE